jgi:hypothetical protein
MKKKKKPPVSLEVQTGCRMSGGGEHHFPHMSDSLSHPSPPTKQDEIIHLRSRQQVTHDDSRTVLAQMEVRWGAGEGCRSPLWGTWLARPFVDFSTFFMAEVYM